MESVRAKVIQSATASRLVVIVMAIIFNLILPDHDAGVFQWTYSSTETPTACDKVISFLTDGLTRWDGQYFLHIANHGYTYENTLAFFPLYPIIVRAVAEVLHWMQVDYGLINFSSSLKLAGVMVNVAAFVAAAVTLYELSRKVLRDEYMAYRSALLFCINPASIFFTACYSEALHAAMSFAVMWGLERGITLKAVLFLMASSAVRSNAIINVGFVGYKTLKLIAKEVAIHKRLKQLRQAEISTTIANIIGDGLVPAAISFAAGVGPFVAFQWYAFTEFCGLVKPSPNLIDENVVKYASENELKLPLHPPSDWCHSSFPNSYSYIQSHYWGVGFLKYFEVKQIPQFLLAFPILYLVATQSYKFLIKHHPDYSIKLGLTYFRIDPSFRVPQFDAYAQRGLPRAAFVYVIQAAALATFCFFNVHVQVSTRIICSSCPAIYWWLATMTTPENRDKPIVLFPKTKEDGSLSLKLETQENLNSYYKNLVMDEMKQGLVPKEARKWLFYSIGYCVVGTALFSNFLPWT